MTQLSGVPYELSGNQPADRFYRGGPKILRFRSRAAAGNRVPEDWVASTTTVFGESETGLSKLSSGERLRDAIASDPIWWLGEQHVRRFGSDTKILIKLLDAGERLPVHIHPSHEFALEHVGAMHGKAEAWWVIEGGTVHVGFTRDVSESELAGWVDTQDVDALLSTMHLIEVRPGDSIFVPPGLPHAIGSGVFIVEVQEPEDMSILLEWKNFAIDGPRSGHLGLGFDTALTATDRRGWSLAALNALIVRGGTGEKTLVPAADEYFRAELYSATDEVILEAGFSTLVFLSGQGILTTENGSQLKVQRGATVLAPYGIGTVTVSGDVSFLRCRPPR
jgi:mannose-6-phosphate isomerase